MKELETYTQETSFSCGAASLLIAYHKLEIDYNEPTLMIELGTSKDTGTDFGIMYNHALATGFSVEMKGNQTYRSLKKDSKRGVIIVAMNPYWGGEPGGHYAVVETVLDDMIELADPALQKEDWPNIMSKREFLAKWNCPGYPQTYLLIKPK